MDTVAVIGVGSLGSFFCKSLLKCSYVNQLFLVDHDVVKRKNLESSYFFEKDIDNYKVDALKENLRFVNNYTNIITRIDKFSKSLNITSDLVIDCRDSLASKETIIDVKLSLNGKFLIIDCKKDSYDNQIRDGLYIHRVSKEKLEAVCDSIIPIFESKQINYLLENDEIKQIDIEQTHKNFNLSNATSNINLDDTVVKETTDVDFSEVTDKVFSTSPNEPVTIQFVFGTLCKTREVNLSKIDKPGFEQLMKQIIPEFLDRQIVICIRKNFVQIVPVYGGA